MAGNEPRGPCVAHTRAARARVECTRGSASGWYTANKALSNVTSVAGEILNIVPATTHHTGKQKRWREKDGVKEGTSAIPAGRVARLPALVGLHWIAEGAHHTKRGRSNQIKPNPRPHGCPTLTIPLPLQSPFPVALPISSSSHTPLVQNL